MFESRQMLIVSSERRESSLKYVASVNQRKPSRLLTDVVTHSSAVYGRESASKHNKEIESGPRKDVASRNY